MCARYGVILALVVAVAAPAAGGGPKRGKGKVTKHHGRDAEKGRSAGPPPPDARTTLRRAQRLLEAVAAHKRVTAAERRRLRSLLRDPEGDVVAVAAWALTRLRERGSLTEISIRLQRRRGQPGFAGSAEEAFLRLAPLRMRSLTARQAQAEWGRLLKRDPNPIVRAEAAREVVAAHHPRALELLRGAVEWGRAQGAAARGAVLSQAAHAMRLLGGAAVPDLRAMRHDAAFPHFPYGNIVELEQCQTFMKVPCGELESYHSVDAYARRGLALVTGESERDAETLK